MALHRTLSGWHQVVWKGFAAALIGWWIPAAASGASPPLPEAADMSIAVAPELMRKLSPDAKQRLSEPGLSTSDPLTVMILGTGPFGPDVLSELAARGVKVRTVAGDIATATVPAGALPALLQVDAVRAVELSRPLQPE